MGLAIAGLAMSALGTATSFIDAGKQNKIMAKAEADAQKSLDQAKKEISVNAYKGLSVNKDPYNKERDALVSAGAQAIQAGQESNRGSAATAGRVQMAQVEGQSGIQASQSKEEKQLDMLVANEDSRIKDMLGQIDLQTAQGSQLQARDAKFAKSKDLSGAFAGMGAMGAELVRMAPLYAKDKPDSSKGLFSNNGTPEQPTGNDVGSDLNNFAGAGDARGEPSDTPVPNSGNVTDEQLSALFQTVNQNNPDYIKELKKKLNIT